MTAHKLLYKSRPMPDGKFMYIPKDCLEEDYKLIVVDEVSMLPKTLWDLLLSHKVHVLACGDPFQIPPIDKDSDNHILDNPHIFLDEIMRQAAESEIIRVSMDIRNGKPLNYFKGNEVQIIRNEEVVDGMYDWADQILVATNAKRQVINDFMRQSKGYDALPQIGDKVIALRNCWDTFDTNGEMALVNGTIGYITDKKLEYREYPLYRFPQVPILKSQIETPEGETFKAIACDYTALKTGKKFLTPQQEYQIIRRRDLKGSEPIEFNYGYAITTHRAQGSQWNKVLVYEEQFPFNREEHARHLYTGVTRAAEKLVLVR